MGKTLSFEDLIPSAPGRRFAHIARPYLPADVKRLRGSFPIAHTLAERGANRLWHMLQEHPYIRALGAQTGAQALQMVRGGLEAIYVGGRKAESGPFDPAFAGAGSAAGLVRHVNDAFKGADEAECADGHVSRDWFAPIMAAVETGFGDAAQIFELTKAYIEAGTAAVHCGDRLTIGRADPLHSRLLVPTKQQERTLCAARLAADVAGVPILIVASTAAEAATLITSDVDERDRCFIAPDSRTAEGFFRLKPGTGLDHCIARGLAYAEYADLLCWEAAQPNLQEARAFAAAVHARYPGKLLAYNCAASFNWRAHFDLPAIERFQRDLAALGYKFQFVGEAGIRAMNLSMFDLAKNYRDRGMAGYSELQEKEAMAARRGYVAASHKIGAGYFDAIAAAVSGERSSAMTSRGSVKITECDESHVLPAAAAE